MNSLQIYASHWWTRNLTVFPSREELPLPTVHCWWVLRWGLVGRFPKRKNKSDGWMESCNWCSKGQGGRLCALYVVQAVHSKIAISSRTPGTNMTHSLVQTSSTVGPPRKWGSRRPPFFREKLPLCQTAPFLETKLRPAPLAVWRFLNPSLKLPTIFPRCALFASVSMYPSPLSLSSQPSASSPR